MTDVEGFVIEEVEMKGFMRYLRRTDPPIRFPGKFTVVTGRTGAGKTTILDAITFALYKWTSRTDEDVAVEALVQPGGHVRLSFREGGARYEVKRGRDGKGKSYLELLRDVHPVGGSIPEKERALQEIVGLDYKGFCNATFVRQEEMKALGSQNASDRLKVFLKLFRLEVFDRARELTDHKLKEAEKRREALDTERGLLQQDVARLEDARREETEAEENLRAAKARVEEARTATDRARADMEQLKPDHDEFLRIEARTRELRQQAEDLQTRIAAKEEEAKRFLALRAAVEDAERETRDLDAMGDELNVLADRAGRRRLLEEQREGLEKRSREAEQRGERRVQDLVTKLDDVTRRMTSLATDVTAEEAFGLLRREGALGERVQRIEQELEWLRDRLDLVERLREEQAASHADLEEVSRRTGAITPDSFVLSELRGRMAELQQQIETEKQARAHETETLRREREVLDTRLDEVPFGDTERRRLEELEPRVKELRKVKAALKEARSQLRSLGDSTKVVEELTADLKRAEAEVASTEERRARLAGQEEAYLAAEQAWQRATASQQEAAQALGGADRGLAEARRRVEDLEERAKRLRDLETRLSAARADEELFTVLKKNVFHDRGVGQYAIEQLLPELAIEASRILRGLTDGRLHAVAMETVRDAKEFGVAIRVQGVDGQWHRVEEFSGGERTQINAALRFAIARELASMPRVGRTYARMKTLVIDEGDLGSLDTEGSRELFVQTLFSLEDFFERIVLVTHIAEVADRFPHRIQVTMNEEGESRAEVVV